jgi:hypothetical protein
MNGSVSTVSFTDNRPPVFPLYNMLIDFHFSLSVTAECFFGF